MYCPNCGYEVSEKAVVCVRCGVSLKGNWNNSNGEERKDWLVTLLLCFFLGYLGVHRFYTGSIGIGVAQLLTLGGCGIWALIDFILILVGSYKDGNGEELVRRN
jgi:TM2 domain-containing membrane protein YozV